jgi:hypothetical protein
MTARPVRLDENLDATPVSCMTVILSRRNNRVRSERTSSALFRSSWKIMSAAEKDEMSIKSLGFYAKPAFNLVLKTHYTHGIGLDCVISASLIVRGVSCRKTFVESALMRTAMTWKERRDYKDIVYGIVWRSRRTPRVTEF